jgi:hypothetical protein
VQDFDALAALEGALGLGARLRRQQCSPLLARYLTAVPFSTTWPWLRDVLAHDPGTLECVPDALVSQILDLFLDSTGATAPPSELLQAAARVLQRLLTTQQEAVNSDALVACLSGISRKLDQSQGTGIAVQLLRLLPAHHQSSADVAGAAAGPLAWLHALATYPAWQAAAQHLLGPALRCLLELPDAGTVATALQTAWQLPDAPDSAASVRLMRQQAVATLAQSRPELCAALLDAPAQGGAQAAAAVARGALLKTAAALTLSLPPSDPTSASAEAASAALALYACALPSDTDAALQQGKQHSVSAALVHHAAASATGDPLREALAACRSAVLAAALVKALPRDALLAALRVFAVAPAALPATLARLAAGDDAVAWLHAQPQAARRALRAAAAAAGAAGAAILDALGSDESSAAPPPTLPPPRPLSRAGAAPAPAATPAPAPGLLKRRRSSESDSTRALKTPALVCAADTGQAIVVAEQDGEVPAAPWLQSPWSAAALQAWLEQEPLEALCEHAEDAAASAALAAQCEHVTEHGLSPLTSVCCRSIEAAVELTAALTCEQEGLAQQTALDLVGKVQCISSMALAAASASASEAAHTSILAEALAAATHPASEPPGAVDSHGTTFGALRAAQLCAMAGLAAAAATAALPEAAASAAWSAVAAAHCSLHADAPRVPWAPCSLTLAQVLAHTSARLRTEPGHRHHAEGACAPEQQGSFMDASSTPGASPPGVNTQASPTSADTAEQRVVAAVAEGWLAEAMLDLAARMSDNGSWAGSGRHAGEPWPGQISRLSSEQSFSEWVLISGDAKDGKNAASEQPAAIVASSGDAAIPAGVMMPSPLAHNDVLHSAAGKGNVQQHLKDVPDPGARAGAADRPLLEFLRFGCIAGAASGSALQAHLHRVVAACMASQDALQSAVQALAGCAATGVLPTQRSRCNTHAADQAPDPSAMLRPQDLCQLLRTCCQPAADPGKHSEVQFQAQRYAGAAARLLGRLYLAEPVSVADVAAKQLLAIAQQAALLESSEQPSSAAAALSQALTRLASHSGSPASTIATHVFQTLTRKHAALVAEQMPLLASQLSSLCDSIAAADKAQRLRVCERTVALAEVAEAAWEPVLRLHVQVRCRMSAAQVTMHRRACVADAVATACVAREQRPRSPKLPFIEQGGDSGYLQATLPAQGTSAQAGQNPAAPTWPPAGCPAAARGAVQACGVLVAFLLAVKKPLQGNEGVLSVAAACGRLLLQMSSVPAARAWLQVRMRPHLPANGADK